MKARKITSLGLLTMAFTTGIALMGTTVGTLAWYAYSVESSFSFQGTSVAKSMLLSVGLIDDQNKMSAEKLIQYNLERKTHDGHSIIFTKSTQGIKPEAIKEYLAAYGYAQDKLFPVSSKTRALAEQGDFKLYTSPEYGVTNVTEEADTHHYVKLPFAFKIFDHEEQVIPNKPVWLTESVTRASGEDIDQAVRVFIQNDEKKFLMKPADQTNATGSTKVAGQLDLDGDGTYDYNGGDLNREYYYGDYTGSLSYATDPYGLVPPAAGLDDVNGTGKNDYSTFLARHNPYARVVDTSNATPKVAEYYTIKSVSPKMDENGDFYGDTTQGIPICKTTSASGIGYATFTIFIEGWDHAVIDRAAGYSFDLGLTFEINK